MTLPDRRPGQTEMLWFNGRRYHLCIGFDPKTFRPAEAFLSGAKVGSDQDALLDSACIILSKLLQAGADPKELSETLGQQCILGAAAQRIAETAAGCAVATAIEGVNKLGLGIPEANERRVPRYD